MKNLLLSSAVGTCAFQNCGELDWLNSVAGAVFHNAAWPRAVLPPDFCKRGLCHNRCLLTFQVWLAFACANCTYLWSTETLHTSQTLKFLSQSLAHLVSVSAARRLGAGTSQQPGVCYPLTRHLMTRRISKYVNPFFFSFELESTWLVLV